MYRLSLEEWIRGTWRGQKGNFKGDGYILYLPLSQSRCSFYDKSSNFCLNTFIYASDTLTVRWVLKCNRL